MLDVVFFERLMGSGTGLVISVALLAASVSTDFTARRCSERILNVSSDDYE